MRVKSVLTACQVMLAITCPADWFGTNPNQFEIPFATIFNHYTNGDSLTGYGGVSYTYRIGKFELLASDWNHFAAQAATFDIAWQAPGRHDAASKISWGQSAMFCNWLTSGTLTNGAYNVTLALTEGVLDPVVTVNALTPHYGTAMDALVASFGQVYVLPTEDEWYKAAYLDPVTGQYTTFANGSDLSAGAGANFSALLSWPAGSGAVEEQNGTFDMMGNLWEMTEDQIVRGGAYSLDEGSGASGVRITNRTLNDLNDDVTFRVVAIPEPSVASLMAVFGIILLYGRRLRVPHD